jgi:uncharacterized membrane protein
MVGFVVVGSVLGFSLREFLGYPLVGEAVYWLGILGFLAVWQGTSISLFDERDRALERRASQFTLTLFAGVLVVGASAARLLSYTDAYAVPTAVWGALWGYVALFVTFAVVYLGLRYRG